MTQSKQSTEFACLVRAETMKLGSLDKKTYFSADSASVTPRFGSNSALRVGRPAASGRHAHISLATVLLVGRHRVSDCDARVLPVISVFYRPRSYVPISLFFRRAEIVGR